MGYHFTKGTTEINYFWGDMHTYTIRADKVLNTSADMMEVVKRFEADRSQFEYTDYFEHAKTHKAAREYTVLVDKHVSFQEFVFMYQGKEYKTTTKKWTVVRKIEKHAEEILSHKEVHARALVDDATGEVIAIREITHELDLLAGDDLI